MNSPLKGINFTYSLICSCLFYYVFLFSCKHKSMCLYNDTNNIVGYAIMTEANKF